MGTVDLVKVKIDTEEKVIRKILVKCPPLADDAFSIFPFLITVSEEFPKAEIFLLCEDGAGAAFGFLPFKARAFERPREKITLMETHRYCANMHDIFNIDLFFDLENTFNSAFMGFNFRATERVGYAVGWNKFFLTKKIDNIENVSIENKSLRLLESYIQKPLSDVRVARVRDEGVQVEKIEQLFQEPEPPKFIMILLDNIQNVSKQIELWTKFFDCFHDQKFIIWSQDDEEMISELFAKVDLGHNNLYIHRGVNPKELIYLLNKVKGVVSNNVWAEGLCTYFGVNSISIFMAPTVKLPSYDHFRFQPQRFVYSTLESIKYTYLEEEKELEQINQVVDHIHFHFKL